MPTKVELKILRPLDVLHPTQEGRPSFISAASGLVIKNNRAFVVADDELSIVHFSLDEFKPGELFALFEGQLPLEKKERKKQKPDHESLCLVESKNFLNGALLSFPSGSKSNRTMGALVTLKSNDRPDQSHHFDLSNLYQSLPFRELNIEGALVRDENLFLFQRGNSKFAENAVLVLDLPLFLNNLKSSNRISNSALKSIHHFKLGQRNGKELGFTDGTPGQNGQILFLASTEDTDNPYEDGTFHGATLGSLNSSLQVQWQVPLEIRSKPEGLCQWTRKGPNTFLIVTDSDNASEPATLYQATLS